jgi:hypothetical protein
MEKKYLGSAGAVLVVVGRVVEVVKWMDEVIVMIVIAALIVVAVVVTRGFYKQ